MKKQCEARIFRALNNAWNIKSGQDVTSEIVRYFHYQAIFNPEMSRAFLRNSKTVYLSNRKCERKPVCVDYTGKTLCAAHAEIARTEIESQVRTNKAVAKRALNEVAELEKALKRLPSEAKTS